MVEGGGEMKAYNLIIVEGIPGTGKSTMAQFLNEQLKQNGVSTKWLHEGIDDHFIWNDLEDYFEEDGTILKANFENYSKTLIKKFEEMKSRISKGDLVFILDGNLFAGYTNVYYKSDCDDQETLRYYRELESTLHDLNPLLIYLDTARVRAHTIETWENRAMWGKKVVIESYGKIPHIKRGGYTGDDVLYEYINPLHDQDLEYYETTNIDKLLFNIDERKYKTYQMAILNHLELEYHHPVNDRNDVKRYVGIYDNDRDKRNMFVKVIDNKLVCDWGQMNMALNYVEPNVYNLRSYPIYLKFLEENDEIIGIETFGEQCFRRAGCQFKRVNQTKYEIRK